MTLSLVGLLVIGGAVIHSTAGAFGDAGIPKLNENVFMVEDRINISDVKNTDWNKLADDLSADGYELYIMNGADTVYSNMDRYPKTVTAFLQNINWEETGRAFYMNGSTVVGKKTDGYTVIAVNSGDRKDINGIQQNQFELLLKAFVIIGLIAVATILLISQFFTNWLVKRIMRPINALAEGAKRIVQGNLAEPVVYDGKDELALVCLSFNRMQSYLQEERDRNATYEKARTDMIAGISHDLRTPLTSVKGYIKGLRDGVANTPEKQDQYLAIAYNKATEMDVLLQKLFYFSKLETGNLPLSLTDEDLGDFACKFAMQSRDDLAQMGAKIIADCKLHETPVRIDTEQMHRVLANLTENALEYAASDELTLSISVYREGDMVHLCFSDNGQGVPEEQLEKLFIQFWRGDESRGKRDGGGSGLGLNIVKYIVEAHGGSVSARNENGLRIDILLPTGKSVENE